MTRAVIVDDEALSRQILREMLGSYHGVEIVGEADNGVRAIELIREHDPDVVFLDIQMPEMGGFEVVTALGEDLPAVVFVTAYDQYAVRAFEVEALDYLLKPFDASRLKAALDRVLTRSRRSGAELVQLLASLRQAPSRIPLHLEGAVRLVDTASIDYIEADDKSIRVHRGKEILVTRETLAEMLALLPRQQFMRVHRSAIVNVGSIHEIQPWFNGDFMLILRNGAKVATSRSYRPAVRALMERPQRP